MGALSSATIGPFRGERLRVGAIVRQCLRAGYGSLPLVALISFLVYHALLRWARRHQTIGRFLQPPVGTRLRLPDAGVRQ